MVTKIIRQGEQYYLPIDQPTLDRLEIGADTPLDISTDGRTLRVTPVNGDERQRRFREALENTNQKYGDMLKRLA